MIKIFFGYFYEEKKDPFKIFILNVYEINERNKYSNSIIWNLFFSTTWLTSIGYGVNAPSSLGQRIFCIFYLIFGIPLYLVTLADLAKFCTEGINRLYTECVKFRYYLLGWYRHRKRRIHANSGIEYIAVGTRGRRRLSSRKLSGQLVRNEEEMAEFLWKNLEKTHFVEVPFFLVYILLLAYIIGSAQFVAYLEDWTFFDSLYFIMMSVMTIGFGVPKNIKFILPILFIILIGLIVATTFIDMVGAYYIDRLHFFGRRMDLEQRRIEAMKREAMRKLFETATAMYRLNAGSFSKKQINLIKKMPEVIIPMPKGIAPFNATADSVTLKWEPSTQIFLEGKPFWYTLSYAPRTPHRLNNSTKVIDFLRQNRFVVSGLKSFTLYEFNVRISTSEGSSKPVKCQEYTEPCTVPQLLQLDAISSETATISWRAPRKNNGPEKYLLLFTQEPAPPFQYWRRFEAGKRRKFTLIGLNADTRYIVCTVALHNFGQAAISRSLRFKTRSWWFDEENIGKELLNKDEQQQLFLDKIRCNNFLLPPKWQKRERKPSLREPSIGVSSGGATRRSSLQSGEYQDRS
uniref:Fibronectin type-III domain-containing protein n=1 Tax=Meloidogyne enterolobii TaxID=390850 RepID=A0A6V7WQH4_MELEN|nr:unnamed protein product [Meloidogyne enterolobii]